MKTSVFVGTSLDGFLARRNDTYDFLLPYGEPHGYEEFIKTVDALVIGRRTYEVVLSLPKWFYGKKPVFVLSRSNLAPAPRRAKVERMSGDPRKILSELALCGFNHVYVDGGITIRKFLRAGLVDRMIISRVPILIGEGIPLFGKSGRDISLKHIRTRKYKGGVVQSEYEVLN